MYRQRSIPEEMPDSKELIPEEMPDRREQTKKMGEDTEFQVMKIFRKVSEEEIRKNEGIPDVKVAMAKLPVTVSLSGKKNFKAVTNWMRKHMEAYPETAVGFFVKFIDEETKGYIVFPCDDNEKGEKINGVNYKILPYTYEVDKELKENIRKGTAKNLVDALGEKKICKNQIDVRKETDKNLDDVWNGEGQNNIREDDNNKK